jgi:hypothetical protein
MALISTTACASTSTPHLRGHAVPLRRPRAEFLTFTLPANTLASGQETTVRVQYSGTTFLNSGRLRGQTNATQYTSLTNVSLKAQAPPQVFPMNVTSNIGTTTSNATAQIQYLPQDVGSTGSVYVFAVAPSTLRCQCRAKQGCGAGVAAEGRHGRHPRAVCLAQLNASGQLQAVSASNLQAYVTGVLSAQGPSRDDPERSSHPQHRGHHVLHRLRRQRGRNAQ